MIAPCYTWAQHPCHFSVCAVQYSFCHKLGMHTHCGPRSSFAWQAIFRVLCMQLLTLS